MNPAETKAHWKQKLWFLYRLLARLRFRLTAETTHVEPSGERYRINPYSYIERMIKNGAYEKRRASYLRSHLTATDVFVDIGANIGFFTVIAARKGASVHAFEPDPMNYQRLLRNVKLNGFSRTQVKTYPCALGRESGHALLHRPLTDNYGMVSMVDGLAPDGLRVPMRRLDDVLQPFPSRCVVKIDVEGAELQVLEGAKSFLDRMKANSLWLVEVHNEVGVEMTSVAGRFRTWGYLVSYFDDDTGEITARVPAGNDILLLAGRPKDTT